MKKDRLRLLLDRLDFLKFSLSNTVDPINAIHLEGLIKETENEINKIGENKIKGGIADDLTLSDIEKKHNINSLKKELDMGSKIEMEHTDDPDKAIEIAMDHLFEDPKYYDKLSKIENNEQTMADSSGSFEAPLKEMPILKKDIYRIHNSKKYGKETKEGEFKEITDASSSGAYDVPFGGGTKGRKDPLRIDGVKSIANSMAVKKKGFPKWGGPDAIFIKIKEKCKKFPYCNQGDINNIEPLKEAINETAKKYGLPINEVEKIVLNEINRIFI